MIPRAAGAGEARIHAELPDMSKTQRRPSARRKQRTEADALREFDRALYDRFEQQPDGTWKPVEPSPDEGETTSPTPKGTPP